MAGEGASRLGVRWMHLVGRSAAEEGMARLEEEGGELGGAWSWLDEAKIRHVYLAWRWRMAGYPMWVSVIEKGDLREAAGRAAVNYQRRHGEWPNAGMMRNGEKKIVNSQSSIVNCQVEVQLVDEEGREVGRLRLEEAGWCPKGCVAVWREERVQEEEENG